MRGNYSSQSFQKYKNIHYDLIRRYYRESIVLRNGYYDARKKGKNKHDLWQLKIFDICISILDEIFKCNKNIKRIADIGCGMGDFTIELAKRYTQKEIVGLDFLEETVALARKNAEGIDNISFIQGDLLNTPFKEDYFDITLCINVLHHVYIEDLNEAIEELTRITNKFLIVEIRNSNNIFDFWYNCAILPYFYKELPAVSHSTFDISNLVKNKDFKLQKKIGIFPVSKICRRLLLSYERK